MQPQQTPQIDKMTLNSPAQFSPSLSNPLPTSPDLGPFFDTSPQVSGSPPLDSPPLLFSPNPVQSTQSSPPQATPSQMNISQLASSSPQGSSPAVVSSPQIANPQLVPQITASPKMPISSPQISNPQMTGPQEVANPLNFSVSPQSQVSSFEPSQLLTSPDLSAQPPLPPLASPPQSSNQSQLLNPLQNEQNFDLSPLNLKPAMPEQVSLNFDSSPLKTNSTVTETPDAFDYDLRVQNALNPSSTSILQNIKNKVKDKVSKWNSLSTWKKVMFIVSLVLFVSFVVYVVYLLAKPAQANKKQDTIQNKEDDRTNDKKQSDKEKTNKDLIETSDKGANKEETNEKTLVAPRATKENEIILKIPTDEKMNIQINNDLNLNDANTDRNPSSSWGTAYATDPLASEYNANKTNMFYTGFS